MTASEQHVDMPTDLARRTLIQRHPLVRAISQARNQAMQALVPDIQELATGFAEIRAMSVRDVLLAQQIRASADLWEMSRQQASDEEGQAHALQMGACQMLAKAMAAAGDSPSIYEELPVDFRAAVMDQVATQNQLVRERPI